MPLNPDKGGVSDKRHPDRTKQAEFPQVFVGKPKK